jgi:hypothetical protein
VDGTVSRSCPVTGFSSLSVKLSIYATKELTYKIYFREIRCEAVFWV